MTDRAAKEGALPRLAPYLWSSLFALLLFSGRAAPSALAWDAKTHRLITRLAVEALPPSALAALLSRREKTLERYCVEPDSILKKRYGRSEAERHFINLECFGDSPFSKLDPSIGVMRQRFGRSRLRCLGTLPWTIEQMAGAVGRAWRTNDCASALRFSGYLSHYAGDASQPLHTTIWYDGSRRDRGIHSRTERVADESIDVLEPRARPLVRIEQIDDLWSSILAEIRNSHRLIPELTRDDREVRADGTYDGDDYRRAMLAQDQSLFAHQIARAASLTASIWLAEWRSTRLPVACAEQSVLRESGVGFLSSVQ